MARYIIIDNRSGYVILDTADYGGTRVDISDPLVACRLHNARHSYRLASTMTPQADYRVYQADEDIPVVRELRHPHLIELIETECSLVANVRVVS